MDKDLNIKDAEAYLMVNNVPVGPIKMMEEPKEGFFTGGNLDLTVYMNKEQLEQFLPVIKQVLIQDTETKETFLSATVNSPRCYFCEDMEYIYGLKLVNKSYMDGGVLYEDINDASYCPVCGQKLPEEE